MLECCKRMESVRMIRRTVGFCKVDEGRLTDCGRWHTLCITESLFYLFINGHLEEIKCLFILFVATFSEFKKN